LACGIGNFQADVHHPEKTMKRLLFSLIKIAVTLLLLVWVISRYEVSKLLQADFGMMALAVGIFILSNFLGALQWQKLLHGQDIAFAYTRAANLYFIGLFFNNFLPSSLGGDVVKIYSLSRVEKKGREGLAATFVDRFAGLFLLALFALAASTWLLATGVQTVKQDILIYIIVVFVIFILAIAFLFSRRISRLVYEVFLARFNPLGLKDKFREGHEFFHTYRHQYRLAGEVFFLSLAIQLARVAVHYFCALSIGFQISFIYFLVFVPLIAMAAVIPISFGGLGVRESTAPFLFSSVAAIAAVDPRGSLAVTTQLLASLVGIMVGLIGGVLFILTRTSAKVEISESPSVDS